MTRRTAIAAGCSQFALVAAVLIPASGVAAAGSPAPFASPAATPARPDTADFGFTAGAGNPAPSALHVLADTVAFGGVVAVAWDLPPGAPEGDSNLPKPADDRLVTDDSGGAGGGEAALAALPPAAGKRVVKNYRVYHTGPFRLEWAGRSTPVVQVRGRVGDPGELAAIRDPRPVPWLTATLVVVLLAVAGLVATAWWWWRRRRKGTAPGDWPLPEPAWLSATLALRDLLAERRIERGEAREFLDGLAAVARRFAGRHYGVPAADLTGGELQAACAARGHAPIHPGALARLIDAADLHRYDPRPPSPEWCRRQAGELLAQIGTERVQPRHTPVPAALVLEAGEAWAELSRELAVPGDDRAAAGGGY